MSTQRIVLPRGRRRSNFLDVAKSPRFRPGGRRKARPTKPGWSDRAGARLRALREVLGFSQRTSWASREAQSQTEFRRIWAGRAGFRIPRLYPELGTRRILVTELVDAENFQTFVARASQTEKNRAATLLWQFAFESIFRHNIFNADPHPGNYLFKDGEVIFLDFGCVKRFSSAHIALWRALARATLERDLDTVDRLTIETGIVPNPARFDFQHHHRTLFALYEPWLLDRPFRCTEDFVQRAWSLMAAENPNRFLANLPKDWVLTNRLQLGLYSPPSSVAPCAEISPCKGTICRRVSPSGSGSSTFTGAPICTLSLNGFDPIDSSNASTAPSSTCRLGEDRAVALVLPSPSTR